MRKPVGQVKPPVHERELWLHNNPEAMASLERGLRESAEGKTQYLGSFEKYADESDGDES